MDPELGQPQPHPGRERQNSNAPTELLLKFTALKPCILEYRAEVDRLMSSLDAHQEQSSAHLQTGRRMVRKVHLLTVLYLLFTGALYLGYYFGNIDINPPWSTTRYILAAEFIFVILQIMLMWECYEHHKRALPAEFPFKFDFENMPVLEELVGERKWKQMRECSDNIRNMEEFNAIIRSFADDIFSKFQISADQAL